ncbi:MAG: hypothetical protein QM664_12990, partial [Flavihumibacter sp.]
MKKISLYLGAWLLLVMALSSCSKEFQPGDPDGFTIGAYIKELEAGNSLLTMGEIASSVVTKKVGQVGSDIEEVKIWAAESKTLNKADWKLVKTVPFTDGMELSVTGAEIATAL